MDQERRKVTNALRHMWHVETKPTIENHYASFSHLSTTTSPTWSINLTLLHWSLKPREEHSHSSSRQNRSTPSSFTFASEAEAGNADFYKYDGSIFPPDNLGHPIKKALFEINLPQPVTGSYKIQRNASSVVISTNLLGDFGKCTVLTTLLDDEAKARISQEAIRIWNACINQPQITRCLIGLAVVGALCSVMQEQYEVIIKELTEKIDLGVSINQLFSS
jgi:hypothetical protein